MRDISNKAAMLIINSTNNFRHFYVFSTTNNKLLSRATQNNPHKKGYVTLYTAFCFSYKVLVVPVEAVCIRRSWFDVTFLIL